MGILIFSKNGLNDLILDKLFILSKLAIIRPKTQFNVTLSDILSNYPLITSQSAHMLKEQHPLFTPLQPN